MSPADSFPDPDQLLSAAEVLIEHGEHPGHWRRSVSSSYYAAFHAITGSGAALVFQENLVADRGRRWFKHHAMAGVAQSVTSAAGPDDWRRLGFRQQPSSVIQSTCRKFVSLHSRREGADYAGRVTGPPRETEARKALTDARSICDDVKRYVGAPPNEEFVVVVAEMMSRSVDRSRLKS